ncbi:MAG: DUF2806 domain-containing protein [Sphingomonas sp.]
MTEDNQDGRSNADDGVASKALATIDKVAPKGWRLRLAKASAQLLVGTRAGAAVYAEAREHLDEIEGRSAMNKQLYATATQQILNDPEMVERAKARLVGGMLRKQENLEAVISGATERVLALPSPDQLRNDSANDQPNDEGSDAVPDEPLNPDWAAAFTEVAENATSEELRERLSRMLAGEIESAGTFPRATIRAIAELERSDLEGLIKVLPFTHGNAIVNDDPISTSTLQLLKDCGLVDYNPTLGFSTTWNAKPDAPGAIIGSEWALIMEVSQEKTIHLPIVPLTRTGKSVISLLDQFDERLALKNLAGRIDKTHINRISLGKYEKIQGSQVKIPNGEVIFLEPVVYNVAFNLNQSNQFKVF